MKKILARARGSTILGFLFIVIFMLIGSMALAQTAAGTISGTLASNVLVGTLQSADTAEVSTEVIIKSPGATKNDDQLITPLIETRWPLVKDSSTSYYETNIGSDLNPGLTKSGEYHSLKLARLFSSEVNLNNLNNQTASTANMEHLRNC